MEGRERRSSNPFDDDDDLFGTNDAGVADYADAPPGTGGMGGPSNVAGGTQLSDVAQRSKFRQASRPVLYNDNAGGATTAEPGRARTTSR